MSSTENQARVGFPRSPRECDISDDTLNQLVERGFLAPKSPLPPPDPSHNEHPVAKELYRSFKPGSRIMTKVEAYKLGRVIDELAAEIRRLTALLGQDEQPLDSAAREVEDAIDDALDAGVGR